MPSSDTRASTLARARIAELAARFIAEHGIRDYGLAKRKAVRQLGLQEGHGLPSNEEVDAALIERQSLFEPEDQVLNVAALRRQARDVMRVFERFDPRLVGAAATGAVSEHSLIELEMTVDSSKEFEQYLVNQGIEFKTQDHTGHMAYLVYAEPSDVLMRLSHHDSRYAQGGQRPRLTLDQLERLLRESAPI